jgi:hypothetical protein
LKSGAVAPLWPARLPEARPRWALLGFERDALSRGDVMIANTMLESEVAAEPVVIPVRAILPWAILGGLVALLAIYFVGAEQGATSIFPGMYIHELVHDGRHFMAFPCH